MVICNSNSQTYKLIFAISQVSTESIFPIKNTSKTKTVFAFLVSWFFFRANCLNTGKLVVL